MALPQEKPVLRWLKKSGAGRAFTSLAEFHRALAGLLDRHRTGEPPAHPNTAAAELPAIIAGILDRDNGRHGE